MKRKPKLGQNFLVDDAARHAIVDALGDLGKRTVISKNPQKTSSSISSTEWTRCTSPTYAR